MQAFLKLLIITEIIEITFATNSKINWFLHHDSPPVNSGDSKRVFNTDLSLFSPGTVVRDGYTLSTLCLESLAPVPLRSLTSVAPTQAWLPEQQSYLAS